MKIKKGKVKILNTGQRVARISLSTVHLLLCEEETWVAKYVQENKLDVAEMRMCGWMCRVKKLNNRIRNKRIRRTTKMGGKDSPS